MAVIQLQHRLETAQVEVRTSTRMLGLSEQHNRTLEALLSASLANNPAITVEAPTDVTVNVEGAKATAESSPSQNVTVHFDSAPLASQLEELLAQLPAETETAIEATSIAKELESLDGQPRAKVEQSGVLAKIRKLAEDLGDEDSAAAKTVRGAKKAGEIGSAILKALAAMGML